MKWSEYNRAERRTVWVMKPPSAEERVRELEAALEEILEVCIWGEDAILVAQDIAEKALGKE